MTATAEPASALSPRVSSSLLTELARRVSAPWDRPALEVTAPFTETVLGSVPEAAPEDVAVAVERGRRAQERWARWPVRDRVRVLWRFHDLVIDRADTAMDLLQLEGGKSRIASFEEVYDVAATTHYYLKTGPGLLRRRRRAVSLPGMTTAYELRHPVGVVGSITPWNFPLTLAMSDMLPALLAGNAVVAKPDEKTPFSPLYGALLLEEAGLPEDLFQVVTGRGEITGAALVDSADFIMFTGSTAVGRTVAERAGRRLVGSSMELGGKNAAIVLDDADLDKAVPGVARAVFANGGQLCISMERIYVADSIVDEFTERLVEHTRGLEMNARFDFSSHMSSMISRDHLEAVHGHVVEAVDLGATLLVGGKPRPDVGPLFYEPTLLTGVEESMAVCRGETFGPVSAIQGFADPEDAIADANDSRFGLNFSVWTEDVDLGFDIASRLEAGTVGINDGYAAAWSTFDSPMGGMKESGLGRRHGADGLLKFTEAQTVAIQRIGSAFAPFAGLGYESYRRLLGVALKLLRRVPFYK